MKLEGKGAAFEMKHDTRHFQVDMRGLLITARGTQLNVIRLDEAGRTDIYLANGRLEVRGPRVTPFQMTPDEVVKVSDDGTVEKTRPTLAPRQDVRVDGMDYAQVATASNRQNVIYQIEVRGPAKSKLAWGVLDLADPDAWLVLLENDGLKVTPATGLRIVEARK